MQNCKKVLFFKKRFFFWTGLSVITIPFSDNAQAAPFSEAVDITLFDRDAFRLFKSSAPERIFSMHRIFKELKGVAASQPAQYNLLSWSQAAEKLQRHQGTFAFEGALRLV